jgi:hypothetical protein
VEQMAIAGMPEEKRFEVASTLKEM